MFSFLLQENVIELFHNIANNGYTVVYLTARSMAQDAATRKYLFEVKTKMCLWCYCSFVVNVVNIGIIIVVKRHNKKIPVRSKNKNNLIWFDLIFKCFNWYWCLNGVVVAAVLVFLKKTRIRKYIFEIEKTKNYFMWLKTMTLLLLLLKCCCKKK